MTAKTTSETNAYEALIIFKPTLDNDRAEQVIVQMEAAIKNLKGKVLRVDKAGRKRLAFDVARFKDGLMANFVMELPPQAVAPLRRTCKLNEDILRVTLVRSQNPDPNLVPIIYSVTSREIKERDQRFRKDGPGGPGGPGRGGPRRPFQGEGMRRDAVPQEARPMAASPRAPRDEVSA